MLKRNVIMIILLFLMAEVLALANPAASTTLTKNDGLEIETIGSLDIPKGAQKIRVWGNYAYIIDGNDIMRVIDISNPSAPHETDSISIPEWNYNLEIAGGYAYVTTDKEFRVIDIRNPTRLKDVAGFDSFLSSYMKIKDNTVFLIENFNRELSIINISNPLAPQKIGSYDLHKLYFVNQIEISGKYAYLYGTPYLIEIIDISTPSAPIFAGSFPCPRISSAPEIKYYVDGKYMYMTDAYHFASIYRNYFIVYDISNPAGVQELGRCEIPVDSKLVESISAAPPYVFCAQGSSGIRVIDVTKPASPSELGVFNEAGSASDIFMSGGYIYVADANSGLKIFKMPSSPTVKIINLKNGQYIWDNINIHAEAYGSDIAKIEFYADDQKLDECGSNNCIFNWNAATYPDGNHTLKVIAYDTANRTAAYEIYVVKDSSLPVIALNRTRLLFGAIEHGVTTDAQELFIENIGGGTLNWSTGGPNWLNISPASGTGNSLIYFSVDTSNLSVGNYTVPIVISDPQAVNSPVVNVTLTIYPAGDGAVPFGYFETPHDGDTVSNSIPVTGWCLDDIGIESVKIYRDRVSGEGSNLVYIGDAVFIEGARPDVEFNYPEYPFNYKAGWGYLLLTNSLPGSGNGIFNIYAIATDKEGNQVTLGTKTIICDNANTVKPFGAIDTPIQGGTAAGKKFVNFGWALTPQPNTIPVDGDTITVWVDGLPLGNPVYNNYREDIATLFPGYNNSNGAIGYYFLDTSRFQNGVHTISWSITDNAGNSDGIGSRYFKIQNAGNHLASDMAAFMPASSVNGDIDTRPVSVKKGWNYPQVQEVYPDDNGKMVIESKELERVVIDLSNNETKTQPYAGYVLVGGKLKALPIGSTLDSPRGIFYWQPGPGFVGDYELVFMTLNQVREKVIKKVLIRILSKFGHSN